MFRKTYIAALALAGFLLAGALGSSPASAQDCGPWNNWCMPQCGDLEQLVPVGLRALEQLVPRPMRRVE
jgi:Spy/CpxP family protein refolding chaperone